MSETRAVTVAVLGSGPSGLYAADALVKQEAVAVQVDVYDRLPTPYGLVRYGVAPDHPNIKSVVGVLQRVLMHERVRFVGGVDFGVDVTRAELLRHYDAVVYALGASLDRPLGIPGEDLPGSYPATDFVAWYSGHPDAVQPFPLAGLDSVAVIGAGNVALDVARMLAKTPEDLAQTDTPAAVLEALRTSTVRTVHIIGRRGPEHAKFTTKELRELGELANASVRVVPDEVAVAPDVELGKAARSNVPVLHGWAAAEPEVRPREVSLRFWLRPVELVGSDRVEALVCEHAELDADGVLVGTGEFETIPVGVVLRAVGYRSHPPKDVSFDERRSVVPNDAGRVLDAAGDVLPGEYVAGWIKRGPTGVIGTNKSDAAETVRSLLADVLAADVVSTPAPPTFDPQLAARGIVPVDFAGWLRIDAEELLRGEAEGRPRSKVHDWDTLRRLSGGAPVPNVTGPPLDPELAPALARLTEHMPASLTPELIDSVRATADRYEPDDDRLRRDGRVDIEERSVPGPDGAPDVPVLICRPAGVPAARAAVLYTHGGGMVMGSARTGLELLLDWVVEQQVAIVSVDYRLAPEHPHPAPVEDCYAALLWTAGHLDDLGVPTHRVLVAGGSAGGGLAAAVALMARDRGGPALIGQVLMSPMLDHRSQLPSTFEVDGCAIWDRTSNLTGWAALLGAPAVDDAPAYASPARAADLSGLPPAYLDVGSAETLRDEGVAYASRIWQAGGVAELHVWPGGFHGFDTLVPGARLSVAARARRTEWLERLLDDAADPAGG